MWPSKPIHQTENESKSSTVQQITSDLELKMDQLLDLQERLEEDIKLQEEIQQSALMRIADNQAEIEKSIKTRQALNAIVHELQG